MALEGPPPQGERRIAKRSPEALSRRRSALFGSPLLGVAVAVAVLAVLVRLITPTPEPGGGESVGPTPTLSESPAVGLIASPTVATIVSPSPAVSPAAPTPSQTSTASPTLEPPQTPVAAGPPPATAPPTIRPETFVGYKASYLAPTPPAALTGVRAPVTLTVTNTGTRVWAARGETPVQASTHILDVARAVVTAEGPRTNLPADLGPGDSATVTLFVDAPLFAAEFILQFDLVVGDVWFSSLGTRPYEVKLRTWSITRASLQYRLTTVSQSAPGSVLVSIVNTGLAGFGSTGRLPVTLSSHWLDAAGAALLWDGPRATIPYLDPGAGGTVTLPLAPPPLGTRQLAVDLVQEGTGWFGVAVVRPVTVVP